MAELSVTRKTVSKLFSEMQGRKFIIPEYQRPYKWNEEMCETLWQDITDFYNSGEWVNSEYFLGTIVSFTDESDRNELHLIDGQQRITTFFLLLRAVYYKLERMQQDDPRVVGLKNQIAPCLWDVDPISQLVFDKSLIHINSLVATAKDNEVFHAILETGEVEQWRKDGYSANYAFFRRKCDEFAEQNPMNWQEFCVSILQRCILLPIECSTSDTALKIFSTLNNRGLPLSDSDIFKAAIYKVQSTEEAKSEFNDQWKEITEICEVARCTIDDLFRYYSHFLRGQANDVSREIGLRKFYESGAVKNERLCHPDLMINIDLLAKFWLYANTGSTSGVEIRFDSQSWKSLHILNTYPNEFWKFAVSVFYLKKRHHFDFTQQFSAFIQRLSAFLLAKFIERPTVNAITDDIFRMCVDIANGGKGEPQYKFEQYLLEQRLKFYSSSRITRALLLTHAYLHPEQVDIINGHFDIEHIFPKKWQTANYNGWDSSEAREHLERFGNKVLFEKRLNIQAGNGYFSQKKSKYAESGIHVTRSLANYSKPDWVKEDIDQREQLFTSDLIAFFKEHLN